MNFKILTVLGARPQFVKAAVVSKALLDVGINEVIVHSGQHYDDNMSDIFWREMGIPEVSFHLNAGPGAHGEQTAQIMAALERIMLEEASDVDAVMVYGDTNTTLAAAIVAAKLHKPVIHVEAGLRSFNRRMPEEINRIVTDHVSSLFFCSSQTGVKQLETEGITQHVYDVGDVMYDAFLNFSKLAEKTLKADIFPEQFILATVHRPSNTDDPGRLRKICEVFRAQTHQVVWPVHPRNKKMLKDMELPKNVICIEPLGYTQMLLALRHCAYVITDSGGLQKEAYWAKKQCFTLRDDTEWVETLEGGWNNLLKLEEDDLLSIFTSKPNTDWKPLYGDGKASVRIADIIKNCSEHFI